MFRTLSAACVVVCLVVAPFGAYGEEVGADFFTDSEPLNSAGLMTDDCSSDCGDCCSPIDCGDGLCFQYDGFFAGVGASYNSVKLNQNLYGAGSSNVYIDNVLVATGVAGGPTTPFVSTQNTLAPVFQAGLMKGVDDSPWLLGTKFSYKYLGLNFDDEGILDPQGGGLTPTIDAPNNSTFSGHEIFESVQTAVNHQLSLFPLLGHDLGRGGFYFGGGPVVFSTEANIYRAIGFADLNGTRMNVTGDPVNFTDSSWMWGGRALWF